MRPGFPVGARGLCRLPVGLRRTVCLQVGDRVGEARVVWLDLQQCLVTADRVVEPGHAVAPREIRRGAPSSEVVASALGVSAAVDSGNGESETVAEGLGVGLPWTPPVAALAIVPATMSREEA